MILYLIGEIEIFTVTITDCLFKPFIANHYKIVVDFILHLCMYCPPKSNNKTQRTETLAKLAITTSDWHVRFPDYEL